MSDKKANLEELKVESLAHKNKNRKLEQAKMASRRNEDFVYVNPGFVGSMNSMREIRLDSAPPPTVVREQYWACAKWPSSQRNLAILVAILFGTIIGLSVTMIIRRLEPDLVVFRARASPD